MSNRIRDFNSSEGQLDQDINIFKSLKTTLQIILKSPAPIAVVDKSESTFFCNDAFLTLVGQNDRVLTKNTWIDGWPNAGKYIEDIVVKSMKGEAISYKNLPFNINRNGIIESIILNLDCSPIYDDTGNPAGALVVAFEVHQHSMTEYKKAEKISKENEKKFSSIFNQTSVGMAQTDLTGRFILVNERYCKIVGRSKEELYQCRMQDITYPEDLSQNMPLFKKLIKEAVPFKLEKRYVRADGSIVWVHMSVSAIKDNLGQPQYVIGVAQDINDRKLAEEALKESEHRYRTLIEEASVATGLYIGKDLRIQYLNKIMIDYFGKGNEIIGKPLKEVLPEIANQIFPKLFDEVFNTGIPFIGIEEKADLIINGILETFYFNFTYKPLRDQDGNIYGIHHIAIDVTDQVRSKMALKESEERFRSLADQSPMIVFLVEPDANATMSYFNKEWLNYTGQTFEEAIGQAWHNIVHPEDVKTVMEIYLPAFTNLESYTIPEIRLKRYDGEFRWHLFKGSPRYLSNGEFMGYVGVGIDIHEQKMVYGQLEVKNLQLTRINNDLDNFIYTASHDLKAPISNIEGLVNVLNNTLNKSTVAGNVKLQSLIKMIYQSIERFKNTIRDLTEVAKADDNQLEDVFEIFFKEMLEEVKLNIKRDIDDSNAIIKDDFSQVPSIYFSKKNLRSIIYNLVSNAIKYRSKERPLKIHIASQLENNQLILTVQDNGLGIKNEDKPKVFTMFKRFHRHVEGTGIGLSIVKKIVDNSGGKIEIESEVGKGSLFKVFFLR